jgi:hypothetical protein
MMKPFACLLAAACLAGPSLPAWAQAQSLTSDQASARAEMQAGRNLPIRDIERQLVPRYEQQGYEYLTFEYDGVAAVYRLKFIKDGNLLFVDADARNGRVLRERR